MKDKHIGSSFDSFLDEQGLLAETEALALKRVFSWQLTQAMKKKHWSKSETAKRMKTTRVVLDRLLDPTNTSVTLKNLERAAVTLGKKISIELTDIESINQNK